VNIFVLSRDIEECARFHCDKHMKMVLESAQLLSTAVRARTKALGIDVPNKDAVGGLYRISHLNHPSSIWARETRENFLWLCSLGEALSREYTHRYHKRHASQTIIERAKEYAQYIPQGPLKPFAQAMPDKYKHEDAVIAYRNYYNGEKYELFKWTNRPTPDWVEIKAIPQKSYVIQKDPKCRCGTEAEYVIDPYAAEVHGIEEWVWMCKWCQQEAAADV
jgi:hypothetical protein